MTFDGVWFYILAVLPVVIGGLLWATRKQINWAEWLASSLACFAMAGIFHWIAIVGATADTETWSGHIVKAVHYPRWVEQYQQMHTRSVSDGKGGSTLEIYYTTEYRTHHEHWTAYSNIETSHPITQAFYAEMVGVFGRYPAEQPHKSGFYSGDRNVYPTYNQTHGEHYPITDWRRFVNKVKATPTTFSFAKVPPTVSVHPYPANDNAFKSDRLVGTAVTLDLLAFDRMNARLGPSKRVNVILVGMGARDSSAAQWQEAAWLGGRKNDVVICWGGSNLKPTWVRAFGWTERKTCLRNLESIVLENGAKDTTLPLIEREIVRGYTLKDWDKAFAHIRVPAPAWAVWTYLAVMVVTQAGFWWWAHANEYEKGGSRWRRRYGY
jgi:hypothetical protein